MMERKRLVADRFQRIWHIVEYIAREPGKSRRELTDGTTGKDRLLPAVGPMVALAREPCL